MYTKRENIITRNTLRDTLKEKYKYKVRSVVCVCLCICFLVNSVLNPLGLVPAGQHQSA